MSNGDYSTGWICVDCLLLEANGDGNPDWTEDQLAAHVDRMAANTVGYNVTLGLPIEEHDDDCPNVADDGTWLGSTDCDCESMSFSWQSCALCRSTLGGSRHAVTLWPVDNDCDCADCEPNPYGDGNDGGLLDEVRQAERLAGTW